MERETMTGSTVMTGGRETRDVRREKTFEGGEEIRVRDDVSAAIVRKCDNGTSNDRQCTRETVPEDAEAAPDELLAGGGAADEVLNAP